jgi:hypothetical protein
MSQSRVPEPPSGHSPVPASDSRRSAGAGELGEAAAKWTKRSENHPAETSPCIKDTHASRGFPCRVAKLAGSDRMPLVFYALAREAGEGVAESHGGCQNSAERSPPPDTSVPDPINRSGPRHVCRADLGYRPPLGSGRLDLLSRDLVHPVLVGLQVANPHLPPRQERWD